jgi:hypothetical protein
MDKPIEVLDSERALCYEVLALLRDLVLDPGTAPAMRGDATDAYSRLEHALRDLGVEYASLKGDGGIKEDESRERI